ncbi:hypothetical protein OS493_021019 [Desmophyllum pertusum]|uniref:PAS domain-containing protein n=1 Tax=Desmophyllum pertusum TaxID=174260 RepID=A0A9X0A3N9_9CNID|nr:hypothetical protein OS493_021019 [Desmophyllum pertusum]
MLVLALDHTGKVVYVSDNVHASLGHLPGHVLQRDVFELIHARDHFIFQGMLWALKNNTTINPSVMAKARPLNRFLIEKTLLRADGPQTTFTATLSMEGKYDYLDKRVAAVLGFFPTELIGSSLYQFCHAEDLDDLVEYHQILHLTGRITTCYYRHLTKGQAWIWLRSRYHLSYSDWSSKPQAVTCLTWVVPYIEVCAKQADILTRNRDRFAQIKAGTSESIDGKSTSTNSLNLTATASPVSASEIGENSPQPMRITCVDSPSLESSMDRTPGSLETRSSCTSMVPYISDMDEHQPIDFKESFQFLKGLNLPLDMTSAQQSLHQFLETKYVQIINAINKQTEELGAIQKQIKIQGELRDLIERLEKERSTNSVENEYNTTKLMREKLVEMRGVCAGSRIEKATAESLAICSSQLQEIGVESRSQELESAVISEQNQQMTSAVGRQHDRVSPMQVEQPKPTQTQPDIFFNQEHWLQTQAQQVQLQQQQQQQQQFLMHQMLSSQYLPPQKRHQQQQMLVKQLQQQQLQQQQQQQTNQTLVTQQLMNPINTCPAQSPTNTLQQNSPHSANDSNSLHEYQWY